jgi:asparagine synthase (glutamine-hydrolysing)
LLKRYLEGRVPHSAIYRPKQGFEIPLARWLRSDLQELAQDLLFAPRSLGRGFVRPERLRTLWRRHQQGIGNHAPQLWAVMMLELWSRTFLDQGSDRSPVTS